MGTLIVALGCCKSEMRAGLGVLPNKYEKTLTRSAYNNPAL